jgi:hypothetical protein
MFIVLHVWTCLRDTKLRDSNATYRDNLLWRIVMHFGEMPWATLGSSDLRSQVAIFGEWNIYGTRKTIILLNFKSVTRIWKKNVQLTKSWKTLKKKTNCPNVIDIQWNKRRNMVGTIRAWWSCYFVVHSPTSG